MAATVQGWPNCRPAPAPPRPGDVAEEADEREPDITAARRFLTALAEGELVTFQAFDDSGASRGALAQHFTADLEDVAEQLWALNERGAGIFVMVNQGDGHGRRAENVVAVRSLVLDLDGSPLEPVLQCGVEPHIVVESSPGKWHVYWLVRDCPLDKFSVAQAALAAKFGGDGSVKDLPRVMRLPGFWHRKGEPQMVRLDNVGTHQAYAFDDLVTRLGLRMEAPAKAGPTTAGGADGALIAAGGRTKFIERRFGELNRIGLSLDTILSVCLSENHARCQPPLSDAKVETTVRGMLKRYPEQRAQAVALEAQQAIAVEEVGSWLATEKVRAAASSLPAQPQTIEPDDDGTSQAPKFDYACAPGILGRFIKSETEFSEAPPIGVLGAVITRLCADAGRTAYYLEGRAKSHLRIFVCAAGPSGIGRKGTANSIVNEARAAVFNNEMDGGGQVMGQANTESALSTGEGLIHILRTTRRSMDSDDFVPPGLEDNRLLINAQEFAGVLKKASGKENTLSATLREGYDGSTLSNTSMSNPMRADRPHIVINASIPDSELVRLLSGDSAVEVSNGLLNRFLLTWQVRPKIVDEAFPGATHVFEQFCEAYRLAMRTAWNSGRYSVASESTVLLTRSEAARGRYREWYRATQATTDAESIRALLAREANVLRVYSALLALLRGSTVTEEADVEAAILLLKYWRDSIEFIFDSGRQTRDAHQMAADAKVVLDRLMVGKPVAMSDLKDVFKAVRRKAVLTWMQTQSPALVSIDRIPSGTAGRPAQFVTRLR